jgi:signal transduction histidine kinase
VLVDRSSIERAIKNLISNAIKYSADSRYIRISAGTETLRASTRVWIAVEDKGIGIFPDELALIFEPFRRGREAIERNLPGTGLGLSLVRRIMQLHGGSVEVRSEPGAGSTFTLYLPAAEHVTPAAATTSS